MESEQQVEQQQVDQDEGGVPVETSYDPVADCVIGPGIRIPAAMFRESARRKPSSIFSLKPIGAGVVELVEVQIRMSVDEVRHGVIATPQPPPKVMLPEHVARELAAKRGTAAQKVE
jgi:hypothetical protein